MAGSETETANPAPLGLVGFGLNIVLVKFRNGNTFGRDLLPLGKLHVRA